MTTLVDAPPHAMFRVLIRWGRFVFEPHAAPTATASLANQQTHFLYTTSSKNRLLQQQQQQNQDGPPAPQQPQSAALAGTKENVLSAVEQTNGTEYRLVWFRAIDGIAIGHTKWCSLTLLHSVVSVIDFQSSPAVIDIASGYMANAATRVILLQLQQRSIDPSSVDHHRNQNQNQSTALTNAIASAPVIAATGAVDMGMFVGSPPRSYIITLEASFFAVGKLHMNLVVKEPKLDGLPSALDNIPLGQQSSSNALLAQRHAMQKRNQRRNLERLTVLVVDSIEAERADGGKAQKVGVYGIARLLQDNATDDKRFPLPADSVYQIKVSFVTDPRYVAKPMLARNSAAYATTGDGNKNNDGKPSAIHQLQQQTHQNSYFGRKINNNKNNTDDHGGDDYFDDQDEDDDDNTTYQRRKHSLTGNSSSADRRVVTFRTLLQKPHDGRVLWRCGIALNPCTKIKFALYRDQARIGSAAIMASQLAVASLPHDFALPIKVRHAGGGNSVQHAQVHQLQINLTISEHTLDTVSGDAISSYLNMENNNNKNADERHQNQQAAASSSSSNGTTGHVCMVPGSDLMVLLRGYEVCQEDKNIDLYLKNHPEANPFRANKNNNNNHDDSKSNASTSPSPRATGKKKIGEGTSGNSPFNTTAAAENDDEATLVSMIPNSRRKEQQQVPKIINNIYPSSSSSPTNYHIHDLQEKSNNNNKKEEKFSQLAPVVLPDELKSLIDPKATGGFVGREASPLTIKITNTTTTTGNNKNTKDGEKLKQQQQQQQQQQLIEPLKSENERLAMENAALREALQEQEERIRDQESYILTLLENQGVVTIVDDEEEGEQEFLDGKLEYDDEEEQVEE